MRDPLPVDEVLPDLHDALGRSNIVILQAPPGTGKTTRVPPSLLNLDWLDNKKVMLLEPRRVAARAAAQRLAHELGEEIGATIGLRTRFDTRVGAATKIEVVTEGVLTRILLNDPSLDGIGAVIFDEFHERSKHADTALVFALETLEAFRPDLRLIIMSATIDTASLARKLRTKETVTAEAQTHPVTTIYRPPAPGRDANGEVADAVVDALNSHTGDILVFLAGTRDIRDAQHNLRSRLAPDVVLAPLHGMLPPEQQDTALRPDPKGRRKVILSTPVAESSVTIDGVGVVIDTGRRRRPEIDHDRGLSRLRTVNASQASTDQRRGRAGRQGPGTCIRLWAEADQARRQVDDSPELFTADLTDLALQLAAWGVADANELRWIDPPPEVALAAARGTLAGLGALDDNRRITDHGRAMLSIGAEPRLSHLILVGVEAGIAGTACDIAALLSDRDLLRGSNRPVDLRARLEALESGGPAVDKPARSRARDTARRFRRAVGALGDETDPEQVGALISQAYPDRIAKRRTEPGSFLLSSGAGAALPPSDAFANEPYLAVAEIQGAAPNAIIRLAAPLPVEDLERLHGDRIEQAVIGGWDRRARDVVFEDRRQLGSLVISSAPTKQPPQDSVTDALLAGVRREGLRILAWKPADSVYRSRLDFMHHLRPDEWPDVSDESLMARLDDWLVPALGGATRRADLERIDVRTAISSLIDWRQRRDLDRLAPTHLEVPSGSRIPIDYSSPPEPVLAVRLQELFGLAESPQIADGAATIVLHLLSPAHRPVQVTSDLASFWDTGYAEVRRELRGRYPKHSWPEDPKLASPTARAKRRS